MPVLYRKACKKLHLVMHQGTPYIKKAITKTSVLIGDHPFTLPDVKPAMKNLWKHTKRTTTGMRLNTDMANT